MVVTACTGLQITESSILFSRMIGTATCGPSRWIPILANAEEGIFFGDLQSVGGGFTPRLLTRDTWTNVGWSWTSDSKSILFHSNRQGRFGIFRQEVEGEAPATTLVSGVENYVNPVLGSGAVLLYTAERSTGWTDNSGRLMSTPLSGGARSILMKGGPGYACSSLPARCIVGEVNANQLIFSALDPATGKGPELGRLEFKRGHSLGWSLSSDASKIALVNDGTTAQILALQDHKVTVLAPRDLKPMVMLQDVCWSADGTHLFITTWAPSSYELLSVDLMGRSRVLYTSP